MSNALPSASPSFRLIFAQYLATSATPKVTAVGGGKSGIGSPVWAASRKSVTAPVSGSSMVGRIADGVPSATLRVCTPACRAATSLTADWNNDDLRSRYCLILDISHSFRLNRTQRPEQIDQPRALEACIPAQVGG